MGEGAGGGVTGLYTVDGLAGVYVGLISFFFGFFFSLPLLSRLPMTLSSHCSDVIASNFSPLVRREPVMCQSVSSKKLSLPSEPLVTPVTRLGALRRSIPLPHRAHSD